MLSANLTFNVITSRAQERLGGGLEPITLNGRVQSQPSASDVKPTTQLGAFIFGLISVSKASSGSRHLASHYVQFTLLPQTHLWASK